MKEMSLYIHIPFCKQKCLYCDFPSYAGKESLINEYIRALNEEILRKCSKYKIASIFVGGGTPSYLNEINLESLLKTINLLDFKDDFEFTIECNPGTLNEEKLVLMKNYNVNRISMGLQTTNDNLLKEIGRIHSFEEFKKNYNQARKAGFENINVDLMFGLPNQHMKDWKASLEDVMSLEPDHISAYSLIIEEGTCFYNLYNNDKLNIPNEEEERSMYLFTKGFLEDYGYNQYEISNYAKVNKECFHNKVYWKCNEYLGLGVSASSFVDEKRFKNIDDIKIYIEKINNNEDVTEEIHVNNINDDMEEFMFMGLRMIEGINLKTFKKRFGKDVFDIYDEVIKNNIKKGLLVVDSEKLYLSEKGIELSNYVMSDFILN
ncbi:MULTISPECIES: radical SAM family heme chaperone HemW [Clostridium]|uniref:radical SAM family heme chaperone HemW n=1 Tax=Clostridium TaxID=1485 RepID=UPI0005FB0735|nr:MULTISPECIES: radical SAM family heme chaperone HemW [Clostridium]KJZ82757.1 putative radical SAM family enzyme in heat shock [Clostridium sp. IBUN22A]KJZ87645.1 putative radical SAM family enzyme in heat shock cluster, similarity with CPO of BS HemN-type [Clostridium sp. IBUN125C]KJZ92682.1 putative radical SAM family enzyme in heat shock [Clostridium sp. IBUN62F]KJZ97703.1 Membrane protein containing HD superfamily hydrolase domain [Clostridium sp. IBUN13A]MDB2154419.1 radical SAM family 